MQAIAQRILLMSGWRRALLAVVAGAVTALALAPFHVIAIGFITFPVLVWLLDGATGATPGRSSGAMRAAFFIGWLFGLGYFVAGLWWIGNALLVEAPEFAWAIPLASVGLPAVLAVFYGAACALARLFWSDGLGRIAALAVAFGLAEWARAYALTGFPWNAIGYAVMPTPVLMQSAGIGGLYAMSAFAVLVFALPAQLAAPRRASVAFALVLCLALLGGHAGYGFWRMSEAPTELADANAPLIRLVQPAIAQERKMDEAERAEIFETLLELTMLGATPEDQPAADADRFLAANAAAPTGSEGPPDIVIWPETAVPFLLTREPGALSAIGDALQPSQSLLVGAVREEPGEDADTVTGRFYNSVMAITTDGVIAGAADKVHLVPFGEYLPFADYLEQLGLSAVAAADRGYSAAPSRSTVAMPNGLTILPLICYEAIFPRHAVLAEDVDVIVNVTNDAWFGRTPGPWQHLHMTRLRSVETGLPVVRVANNGISAVFDPFGRTVARIDHGVRAAADAYLPPSSQPMLNESQRFNNFWLFLLALSAMAIVGRVRWRAFRRF